MLDAQQQVNHPGREASGRRTDDKQAKIITLDSVLSY